MKIVVDASVAIKWVIRNPVVEPNADLALTVLRAIRGHAIGAIAPPHFKAEVLSVVARMRPNMVPIMFGIFESIAIETVETLAAYRRACQLTTALQHHLFDTLYHAVALETDATLVTADAHYYAKAASHGGIEQLSAFKPPA